MITFEKGLSYNFMIERIAVAKDNYYYVIQVENKECWIRMYLFEIYQSAKKNIIRCEYRGLDSFGSHIFIEDKLSILYELYKEKEEYEFRYVKEGIDTEGNHFSVLKDKHGLTHRLCKQLLPEQKNSNSQIRCTVTAINRITKMLMLHILDVVKGKNQEADIQGTNNSKSLTWIDAETLFNSIEKEQLLNDYFYNNLNSYSKYQQQNNFTNLYHVKNKKWIMYYLAFLDKKYKVILVQKRDLYKLTEYADLMIALVNWVKALRIIKVNKLPKLKKYEGLKKAIEFLQTDSLRSYKESLTLMENVISEIYTLLSLFDVDPDFFGKNFSFYKDTSKILYNSIINMDTSDTFQESKKEKCLKAFQGILSYRIRTERKRIVSNIIQTYNLAIKTKNSRIFNCVYSLLKNADNIDNQTIHSYIDMQPRILGAIACIIYGSRQLCGIEDSNELLISINNLLYLSLNYEEKETEDEEIEIMEETEEIEEMEKEIIRVPAEQQISNQPQKQSAETTLFLNLYKNGTYVVTENPITENNITKSIAINPDKDRFILQCYEHGSVNKVSVRMIQEKKRERKYLNGCYSQDCIKEIYVISEETYIATISLYNKDEFIKLYSTEYISEHFSLGLKGNQVVGTNVDSTEYFLISSEYSEQLPKRLIYNSPNPLGKNIKNLYYENDILTLEKMGILKK